MTKNDRRGSKPSLPPPPPAFPSSDAWEDWQPQWGEGGKTTPHRLQETHSPTEAGTASRGARTTESHRRRIVDARLWEGMTPAQQDAAIVLSRAYEMMTRGLGYAASNWQRIPGSRNPSNISTTHARLVTEYVDWTKRCHQRDISHAMILDILVFGVSLAHSDRDRRVRKGTSRKNLLEGLSLYCEMKGWPMEDKIL